MESASIAKNLLMAVFVWLAAGTPTMAELEITESEFRASFQVHVALAQFYRWFQIHERPDGGRATRSTCWHRMSR